MTDTMEVRYGTDLLVQVLSDRLVAGGLDDRNRRKLATALLTVRDVFGLQAHDVVKGSYQHMGANKEWISQQSDSKDNDRARAVYMASFSTADDALMQWRLYGAHGTGVCIGVALTGAEKLRIKGMSPIKVHIDKVRYDRDEIKMFFERGLDKILSGSEIHPVASSLIRYATLLKQDDYKHEEEWRLFVMTNALDRSPEFNHQGRRVRPFLTLQFPENEPSPLQIVAVKTGPCSSFNGGHDEDWKKFVEMCVPEVVGRDGVFSHSEKEMRA
jgi:hypothetical protein